MANKKQGKPDLMPMLKDKNKQFYGDRSILGGYESNTFPEYTDGSRVIMDVNHQTQRVVLDETEFPYVFTNSENMFGHRSTYNIEANSDLVVYKVIPKFNKLKIDSKTQPAFIIFYNKNRGEYDAIYKQDVINLTEKYGIQNNHTRLDDLKEGEVIEKGTPLVRPTSYDKFDNYGFGRNIPFVYRIDMYSLEDSIIVSDVFAKSFVSTEVEMVKVTINDNNFLGNIYGDDEHYKCFPDIGEDIKDSKLCTWKIYNKNQMLFDMKNGNLGRTLVSDIDYYNTGTVVDIDIYSNKERDQIPDTIYNKQILDYIDMDIDFHTKIYNETKKLIDSGQKVSSTIIDWYNASNKLLNKDEKTGYKIQDDKHSEFSGIQIYFLIKRKVGLYKGQKLVGRYGNKGVISEIRPVRKMPHYANGVVAHVIFDSLGVPGRLNIFQLYEQEITAQALQIREHLKTLTDYREKEDILFKFLAAYNEEQAERVKADYLIENKTKKQKEKYFTNYIEKYGIFVHIESFWHKKLLWDSVNEVYDMFDFFEPQDVYFWQEDTQRWAKQIRKEYVGTMYIMKMKQSSKKGLSVRSTGPINNIGLPSKSDDAKKFIIKHSNTPVRSGRQELENTLMFMDPKYIVKEFLFQRNSPVARMELGKALVSNYNGVEDIEVTSLMTNKNVEVLGCYLEQMGYELRQEYDILDFSDTPGHKTHIYNNKKYICTSDEMRYIVARDIAELRIKELESGEVYFGKYDELEDFIERIADEIKSQVEAYMK